MSISVIIPTRNGPRAVKASTRDCHSGNRLGDFAAALLSLFIAPKAWCIGQAPY